MAAADAVDLADLARASLWTALFAVPLAISLWALLDAARRPRWAWALAGRRQIVWLAAVGSSFLFLTAGLAVAGYYLVRVRPAVRDAETGRLAPGVSDGRGGP